MAQEDESLVTGGGSDTDSRDYATVAELELEPGPWRRTNHSTAAPRQLTNHRPGCRKEMGAENWIPVLRLLRLSAECGRSRSS